MFAPWYVYLIGILVALPVFILWGVGAFMLLRVVAEWVTMPEPPAPPSRKASA